jgi:Xaa-Pro dipeptidase
MQAANNITMAAYREIYPKVEAGMAGPDISAMMREATRKHGVEPTFALALVGEASAYPHGSKKVHKVEEGQVILMDCGCDVHGYKSDISRTWVHGEVSAEQLRVWNTVRKGQEVALETAKVGLPARKVDAAVRKFYEAEGFGPNYQLPGLSHRLGHGIGMEVHEPINFVGNEDTPLAPGMCFSNEPGIYLPGKFGVRHEDCLYMTEAGPTLFTGLTPSIDNPMG